MTSGGEQIERFACFGSSCSVLVDGADGVRSAREAVLAARPSLERWHERFSRFEPGSELSLLNADRRIVVPASGLLVRLAAAVRFAGELSGGLVDATLVEQIERAGYADDLADTLSLADTLALAPQRAAAAAAASGAAGWRGVAADARAGTITRPPGVRIDGGGIAKGVFADVLAERLAGHASFAVDCAGDLALGGRARLTRRVHVESPFDASVLHTFELDSGGVATSGITRRSWLGGDGRSAHHLLDPATGAPAFTGIVQSTALAPSALEAEVRAKAALLAGPSAARSWLRYGGVVVLEDGSHDVHEPPRRVTLDQLSGFSGVRAQPAPNRADSSEPAVASPSL
jgi:thiamine biosynthesis lipoprotein